MNKTIRIATWIFGSVASTLGAIAIFYPDLFNLEKQKIQSFEMEAGTDSETVRFNQFLDANKRKIVHLKISVCADHQTTCPLVSTDEKSLSIQTGGPSFSGNGGEEFVCQGNGSVKASNTSYIFDRDRSATNSIWGWYKNAECGPGKMGAHIVEGYFMVPKESGFGQGWDEWIFTPVSEKDVALKNY